MPCSLTQFQRLDVQTLITSQRPLLHIDHGIVYHFDEVSHRGCLPPHEIHPLLEKSTGPVQMLLFESRFRAAMCDSCLDEEAATIEAASNDVIAPPLKMGTQHPLLQLLDSTNGSTPVSHDSVQLHNYEHQSHDRCTKMCSFQRRPLRSAGLGIGTALADSSSRQAFQECTIT
ncbi:hypothetical protein BU25DRAFT_421283 [Macroventuria anomochaeta]|uniref:Uncharacterized protein n=1 Tax=Macroventuria anomochaeta TaxID=301207 RepID=A0ACB6S197_9PLEO|nr:uncharacterized protein BU25DRAFT_421283 [Macroventuria anomochaeta]KAF2627737.1 hypothetical protein BU25DRAFT_421283 [Macroventuria anomochaeta]